MSYDFDPLRRIRFDWTFNLGHVFQILTVAFGGLGVAWSFMGHYYALEAELRNHETRLSFIEHDRTERGAQFMVYQKEMRDAVSAIQEAVGEIKGELRHGAPR